MPTTRRGREVPREFNFHWGSGQIVEEAAYVGQYTEPAIQLLEYEGHPGAYGVRFCYFSLEGRFQRSPMMIDGKKPSKVCAPRCTRHRGCARCCDAWSAEDCVGRDNADTAERRIGCL